MLWYLQKERAFQFIAQSFGSKPCPASVLPGNNRQQNGHCPTFAATPLDPIHAPALTVTVATQCRARCFWPMRTWKRDLDCAESCWHIQKGLACLEVEMEDEKEEESFNGTWNCGGLVILWLGIIVGRWHHKQFGQQSYEETINPSRHCVQCAITGR